MIILPKNPTLNEIYIAAAYLVVTGVKKAEDAIFYPKENERSNIYSEEIIQSINRSGNVKLMNMIDLHVTSKVCEPVIESSKDTIEAIDRVATILKKDCA